MIPQSVFEYSAAVTKNFSNTKFTILIPIVIATQAYVRCWKMAVISCGILTPVISSLLPSGQPTPSTPVEALGLSNCI